MDGEKATKIAKLETEKYIKEGEAELLVISKNVFYNPVQEFNRDLSIAVLSLFAEDLRELNEEINVKCDGVKNSNDGSCFKKDGITILEALSATGLRSIRYAKEIKGIKEIIANDLSKEALKAMKENIRHNGVEHIVKPSQEDAILVMYQNKRKGFHAVDLDPYGCPSTFLDAAVQCVINGGILLVTATDMAVLAGNTPETCYVKYGAISLKTKACHEMALRILLQQIASHAGRHGRYIVPLLSVSADFYIRVFVKVIGSQLKCKDNASKTGLVYQCISCESLTIQPIMKVNSNKFSRSHLISDKNCKFCKGEHYVAGPIWIASLHDQTFVSRLLHNIDNMKLTTRKRIKGVLTMINEELDIPLYYTLDRIMSLVKCITPPMILFRSALLNAGYKVSYSHANKFSIKTDAPTDVIWDIVRAWEKLHPAKRPKENVPNKHQALNILDSPMKLNISFELHPEANPFSRRTGLLRFPENPVENWGPLTRAKMNNN
ncbi:PREDICTED: probable tRNA (guanine(26)-N(2))-dimethyltransferase [Polistes dominula]|uniref:tRNA (guanine(26)-N(2))-dimethyltransferase n=1 Tax=Polistes dominula TaxID=743375 RepID=A0ABM1IGY2_POLDO|nr:PREDICTED: probable tRNA (guanine(26)-N(2))-dimethyltransferase [Polistes dominula]